MLKKLQFIPLLVVMLLNSSAFAQTGVVTGTVTDENGETVPGVNVRLDEITLGASTNTEGEYTIMNVPAGTYTLIATFTGYKNFETTIEVGTGTLTLDFQMEEDILGLDELVVTAFGVQREKRALGYGVSNVEPEQIQNKKETDLARALSGTLPGVDIQSSGGVSGSGTDIVIRGFTSLSGDNSPLWIVDGVIFDSGNNSAGVSDFIDGGGTGNSPNRFIDIDPSNIADVTVLKGLSAAVLYGEKGKNGVIIVTTKSGDISADGIRSREGNFEVSVNQGFGITQISSRPEYQDTYGNGFDQNFGWFFSNWGPRFSTDDASLFGRDFIGFDLGPAGTQCPEGFTSEDCFTRNVDGETRVVVTSCPEGTDCSGGILIEHPLYQNSAGRAGFPEFHPDVTAYRYEAKQDPLEAFYQNGHLSTTGINISGGMENTSVNFNYTRSGEEGFLPNNTLDKDAVSIGVQYKINKKLTAHTTFNFTLTDIEAPPIAAGGGSGTLGGNSTSVFADVFYTPRSIDLNIPFQNPLTGESSYYRANNGIPHPRWTAENVSITNNTDRYFGKGELNYNISNEMDFVYRVGYDSYTENREYAQNPGGQRPSAFQNGFFQTISQHKTILDHNVNVLFNKQLNQDISFNGVAGAQYTTEDFERQGVESINMIVFGVFEHSNFTNQSSTNSFTNGDFQRVTEKQTLGAFADLTLGYQDFIYLNTAARNDWYSTLEPENRSIFYPSVSLSYILSDHLELNSSTFTYLKLFGGVGSSGGAPGLYSTRSTLGSTGRGFVTTSGGVISLNNTSNTLGNSSLKPELHTEYELGVDLRLLDDRLGLLAQGYHRSTTDLITRAPLDPATGFTSTFINIGEVINQGMEISLTGTPVRGNVLWNITANFFTNVSEVTELGAGLEKVQLGSGFTNLGNFAIEGEPYGVMLGATVVRVTEELQQSDPNFANVPVGTPLIDADGNFVESDEIGIIGNPNPDWDLSLINSVRYKGFSLSAQLDYQQGGDMYSQWIAVLMGRGLTTATDRVDRNNSFILPGVLQSNGQPNTLQISPSGVFFSNIFVGPEELQVYDMTHIRLAHLSLSYDLPIRLLQKSPFREVTLSATGDNLWLYMFNVPAGSGFDPNVNSIGGNSRGFEYLTGPAVRRYGFNIQVKF